MRSTSSRPPRVLAAMPRFSRRNGFRSLRVAAPPVLGGYFPPPGLDHPNEVKAAVRATARQDFYIRMTIVESEAA
eukprot:11277545-Heterocapsa_arctica.AAC.1